MPTYEYRCAEGHAFEAFQKMSDDPLTECPECGADAERKISSGAGLVFKGSGFYATDYKNADKSAGKSAGDSDRASGEKAEAKESGGSGEGDGAGGNGAPGTTGTGSSDSGSSEAKAGGGGGSF